MLTVEQWAELRRLHRAESVPIRELARRFGIDRNTVCSAIRADAPPRYARAARPSKLDPFKDELHRLLADDPHIPAPRLRELLAPLGYTGGETILKAHLREVRPVFDPPRTYQRTTYVPGDLAQCDLWEPRSPIPVGFGQVRRAYVVGVTLCFSRVGAGALIFKKEASDITYGLLRCLVRIGGLPRKLVWDREAAMHKAGGHPTEAFAAFCGQLSLGWLFAAPRDPEAKGGRRAQPRVSADQLRAGTVVLLAGRLSAPARPVVRPDGQRPLPPHPARPPDRPLCPGASVAPAAPRAAARLRRAIGAARVAAAVRPRRHRRLFP